MTDFVTAVAERANTDAERVTEVLDAHGIELWVPPPAPEPLTIKRVSFSGRRNGEPYEPFVWEIDRGVWALGSEDNSVGKTTVLHVIRWLLSGTERVDDGSRPMIDVAELTCEIGDDRCHVRVEGPPGNVTGTVTLGEAEPVAFTNETFKPTMNKIMLRRLGLERLVGWQKYRGSDDGREVSFEWASFLPGLFIPQAAYKVLLGEHGGSAGRLLQMFVGMPWFSTHEAAQAALGEVGQVERDADRRAQRDSTARDARIAELEHELELAREVSAPDPAIVAAELDAAAGALDEARRLAVAAENDLRAVEAEHQDAQAAELHARQRLHDLNETEAAAALFGTLKPTQCPRCETAIGDDRIEQEARHVCSVCDRPQQLADTEDHAARLEEAANQVAEATEVLAVASAALDQARSASNDASSTHSTADDRYRAALQEMETVGAESEQQLVIARLEGKLEEVRKTDAPTTVTEDSADSERAILEAVKAEAVERLDAAPLLARLDTEILAVAHRLGLHDITAAKLDRTARMRVHKATATDPTWFSKLNLGERLRLKIATVIALLRVGHPSRHPGLVVLDSPAAEEVAELNLDLMLRELVALADERNDLQILVATIRTESLNEALPGEHIRYVPAGERLW